MTSKQARRFYAFGAFRLDADERVLFDERGGVVPLTPKAFDTLLVLVENSGHVIGKEELMRRVWPDSFVEENNLAQNISMLRKALGEDGGGQKYIETVPKRGYRFAAEVREETFAEPDTAASNAQRTAAGFELPLIHLGREPSAFKL